MIPPQRQQKIQETAETHVKRQKSSVIDAAHPAARNQGKKTKKTPAAIEDSWLLSWTRAAPILATSSQSQTYSSASPTLPLFHASDEVRVPRSGLWDPTQATRLRLGLCLADSDRHVRAWTVYCTYITSAWSREITSEQRL